MNIFKETDMTKGWFVGDFLPTAFPSTNCEVAVKRYTAGNYEKKHTHKIADEITFIVEGKVRMNSNTYKKGTIILIEPNEETDFLALEDTITVVVKVPSVKGDKYEIHIP